MAEVKSSALFGENAADRQLGDAWKAMVLSLPHAAAVYARAVRDHLADCLVTLPVLLDNGQEPSLHFYFANFTGMRKSIFPALQESYESYLKTGSYSQLQRTVADGAKHWQAEADWLLQAFDKDGEDAIPRIQQRCEAKYPL